ncbi:MAG: ferrous iron transport protein B [Opitutales bacterium]|nr:ferrous iron transport protein B [Opitutales bacterium]
MENISEETSCCCGKKHCCEDSEVPETVPAVEPSGFPNVALVGNANTGKTTLFNSLTGLRQHVGNYPGVTVSKYSGPLKLFHGEKIELTDLPGIYSLAATSLDERVVIDVLSGRLAKKGTPRPDAIVCVVDVNNLQRNLFLATQVAELGIPMVLALNQIDVARRDGLSVNTDLLRERLGIPVIAVSARKGEGIEALKQAIADVLKNGNKMKTVAWNAGTRKAIETLRAGLSEDVKKNVSDAELERVIFDVASPVANRLKGEDIEHVGEILKKARECIRAFGENPHSTEALQRYAFIKEILAGVTHRGKERTTFTSLVDKLLLNRVFGVVFFFAAMWGVFWCIYTLAAFPMDWIDGWFGSLGESVGAKLEASPVFQSLVVDGIIAGVGGVLVFLPQILILFFFLGVLESTGYMARAAFLMDKLFGWCGLNGKSFVPMLSGYACGIPGIMGARTIEDPKARLATILAVPFMSCGARMPVYVLMCGVLQRVLSENPAYAESSAGIASAVFVAMYFVGVIVAVPVSWLYTKFVLKSKAAPFVLEMPRYQLPRLRDIGLRVWQSGWEYTRRAGTIIFAMSVIIWFLSYFPRSEAVAEQARTEFVAETAAAQNVPVAEFEKVLVAAEESEEPSEAQEALVGALGNKIDGAWMENSYIGRFGKFCQPVFAPCGFDWRITVGVLGSFPARELIVSTLGITYSLGGDVDEETEDLYASMEKTTHADGSPVFTIPVIIGIMVFFALCGQCLAEIVVIARESSWKWACIAWAQMTFLAWLGAVLCFQIGSLF